MKRVTILAAAFAVLMFGALSFAKDGDPAKPKPQKAKGVITEVKADSLTIKTGGDTPTAQTFAITADTKIKVQTGEMEAVVDKDGKPVVGDNGKPKMKPVVKDGIAADLKVDGKVAVTYTGDPATASEIMVLAPEKPKKDSAEKK